MVTLGQWYLFDVEFTNIHVLQYSLESRVSNFVLQILAPAFLQSMQSARHAHSTGCILSSLRALDKIELWLMA
jgi:hypothetical protein